MKLTHYFTKAQIFIMTVFATFMTFAQDGDGELNVDVNMDEGATNAVSGGDWMANPLVWVIGALVLILIIALVARGGGSKA